MTTYAVLYIILYNSVLEWSSYCTDNVPSKYSVNFTMTQLRLGQLNETETLFVFTTPDNCVNRLRTINDI